MCHNPEHYHLNFLHCEYLNIFVLFLGRGKTEGPTMQWVGQQWNVAFSVWETGVRIDSKLEGLYCEIRARTETEKWETCGELIYL